MPKVTPWAFFLYTIHFFIFFRNQQEFLPEETKKLNLVEHLKLRRSCGTKHLLV